jgi:hypothetical protein
MAGVSFVGTGSGNIPPRCFHEWNTARHSQPAMARSGRRPYTRDELQDLFDCADERVMRIRAGEAKAGFLPTGWRRS